MNKVEFINAISTSAGISKDDAQKALDDMMEGITENALKGIMDAIEGNSSTKSVISLIGCETKKKVKGFTFTLKIPSQAKPLKSTVKKVVNTRQGRSSDY